VAEVTYIARIKCNNPHVQDVAKICSKQKYIAMFFQNVYPRTNASGIET